MTVAEVLAAAHHPTGRYGRTRCPFEPHKSQDAFSYTDEVWHCWACNEGGSVSSLAAHLDVSTGGPLRPPSSLPKLGRILGAIGYESPPDPSVELTRWAEPLLAAHALRLATLHGEAERYRRDIRALLVYGREHPEQRDLCTELVLSLESSARDRYKLTHREFRSSCCDGR